MIKVSGSNLSPSDSGNTRITAVVVPIVVVLALIAGLLYFYRVYLNTLCITNSMTSVIAKDIMHVEEGGGVEISFGKDSSPDDCNVADGGETNNEYVVSEQVELVELVDSEA